MKKPILFILGLMLSSSAFCATWQKYNQGSNTSCATPTSCTTAAFANALTPGSIIVVHAVQNGNTAFAQVPTDTAGNIYYDSGKGLLGAGSNAISMEVWYAINTHTTASNQVTVHGTTGHANDATWAAEFYYAYGGTAAIDGGLGSGYSGQANQTGGASGANCITLTQVSPSHNGDLILGFAVGASGGAMTAGTSPNAFTAVYGANIEYFSQATAAPITPTAGNNTSSVPFASVSLAITGLPAPSNFNAWVDEGVLLSDPGSGAYAHPEQPNAFYLASGCAIISSPCFGLLYTSGPANAPVGVNYAECTTTLPMACTNGGSNPVIAGAWGNRVYQNGSTYYAYNSQGDYARQIDVWTASSLGGTWTKVKSATIVPDGNSWDSSSTTCSVCQLNVLNIVSGTWYGYYNGQDNGSNIVVGSNLATSSDGITWAANTTAPPTIPFFSGNSSYGQVGSVYYGYTTLVPPYTPTTDNATLPNDFGRIISSSLTGPWTEFPSEIFYRTQLSEGVGQANGQVADQDVICPAALGNCYMFFSASTQGDGGAAYTVNLAVASGYNFQQLVSGYEGVNDVPIPFSNANLNTLASDNFARADGSLGANWTQLSSASGYTSAQIVSHEVTCSIAGDNCDSYYSAITWPTDQWSQITVDACAASSVVGLDLRAMTGGYAAYQIYWTGSTGSPALLVIYKKIGTLFTRLTSSPPLPSITVNVGDTLTAAIVGGNIYVYQCSATLGCSGTIGGLIAKTLTPDYDIVGGSPGLLVNPTTATSNAYVGNWKGGSFQNAPSLAAKGFAFIQ